MLRRASFLLAIPLIVSTTGCGTVFKRTIAEVKGASSDAIQVPGTGGGSFTRFGGINVEQPKAESGGLVPAEFKSLLVSNIKKELSQGKEPMFAGGSPTLNIEPRIMWYNKSNALFPHKYAVVLFYLSGDGSNLGAVQIVTKSEATGTGADDLAEDMAKELGKYFKKHGKAPKKDKN